MKIARWLICVAMVAGWSVSDAHVHLKQSIPGEGAVVGAPSQLVLTFTEPALVTALWIQQDGNARQKLAPVPAQASATITVPTPELKPGKYVVTWRAVSPDRHVMSGQLHFTVS
jgi:methionine-rich copper-binding protein CopC